MSTKDKIKSVDEGFIKKGASKITEEDVGKVNDKADEIRTKFEHGGPLGRFINDAKLLLSVVKDYWSGKYRKIPWWAISAIVFTLLYVLSPVDLIPDFIPVVGLLDDAAVMGLCLYLLEQELQHYKEWKMENPD